MNQKAHREGFGRGENMIFNFFSLCFYLRFAKIGAQVFVGAEGKVDQRVDTKKLEF